MTEKADGGAGGVRVEADAQNPAFRLEDAASARGADSAPAGGGGTPPAGAGEGGPARAPAAAVAERWRRPGPLLGIAAVGAIAVYVVVRLFSGGSSADGVFGGELTYRVVRGDLRISFTERGEIKAAKSVEVISKVEGLSRIVSVVPEGTYVEKGDLLVELDSSELTQAINQQQIAVETAESNYLQAQKQVEIQKSLNASSLDQARLDLELAKIDLEKYTGEKELGPRAWNPLALLREDETLLADATDRTADEIRAALERAARIVELERSVGGDGEGERSPEGETRKAEGASGDPPPAPSAGSALGLPEDPAGGTPSGGPAAGSEIAAIVPASGGETMPAAPSAARVPGTEGGGQSAGAIDPGRKLRTGDFLLAYKKAISDVKIASAEVARAKNQWEWTARLAEKGYVTGTELTADTLSLQKAELSKQQAQGSLELFLTYTWRKEYAKYRSAVEQAAAALERAEQKAAAQLAQAEADLRAKETTYNLSTKRLEKLKDQLEKTKIQAPASGMVVYVQERRFGGREQLIEPGAEVRENQLLMRLPDVATMAVSVDVHESWVDQVREGTPAFVSIDALPNLKLRGRVTKIGILPDAVNRWLNPDLKVYQTDVTIEDCPEVKLLRPGMSAKVEVVTAVLKDVIYVPLQSVTAVDRQQACYVLEGGKFVPRTVQGGRHNESFIEIVSGLSEGEIVQLNPPAPKESGREKPAEADEALADEAPGGPPEALAEPAPRPDPESGGGLGGRGGFGEGVGPPTAAGRGPGMPRPPGGGGPGPGQGVSGRPAAGDGVSGLPGAAGVPAFREGEAPGGLPSPGSVAPEAGAPAGGSGRTPREAPSGAPRRRPEERGPRREFPRGP